MKKPRYELNKGFLFLRKNDSRAEEYRKIKQKTGICPDELWNLDRAIARFVAPRLKQFRKDAYFYPACLKSWDSWNKILKQMIKAFQLLDSDKYAFSESERKSINKGLNAFRKYFECLWY